MEVIDTLCNILDRHHPSDAPHNQLKTFVTDRPWHDHQIRPLISIGICG